MKADRFRCGLHRTHGISNVGHNTGIDEATGFGTLHFDSQYSTTVPLHEVQAKSVIMDILLAMPPPVPLPIKVIITVAMAWVMFVFSRLRGARRSLLPAMRWSALVAVSIVITVDVAFPDSFYGGGRILA